MCFISSLIPRVIANIVAIFFNIVTQTQGTDLKYEIGEALAVHGHNELEEVKDFLRFYGLNPQDIVALPFKGAQPSQVHVKTVEQIFAQYLSTFSRLFNRL